MIEPGTILEAADWYDPLAEGGRTAAENVCRVALKCAASEHQVTLGPVAWSEHRPGEDRVPPLPPFYPRRMMLLRAESRVTGRVWFAPKPSRFSQEIGTEDLKRLRAVTRKAWADAYRRKPYKHLKPWLSDAEVDFLIDDIGPETAVKMLASER